MKDKLQIEPMTIKEANDFIESYHRHNERTVGGKFAIGATFGQLGLIGVAITGRPISRYLDDGYTLEVLRCCTCDHSPKNTNSFLYSRCWRIAQSLGYKKLITYTLQTESGSSLRASGFRVIGQVSGVTNGIGWMNRPNRKWHPVYGQDKFRWEISDGIDYEPRKKENHSLASGSDDNSQTNLLELLDGQ